MVKHSDDIEPTVSMKVVLIIVSLAPRSESKLVSRKLFCFKKRDLGLIEFNKFSG